jgi:protein-L-isoaspartate(D-aspartate) O-methyltransferase
MVHYMSKRHLLIHPLALAVALYCAALYAQAEYRNARMQMVDEIQEMVRDTSGYIGKNSLSDRVIQAMAKVPRHEFVPESMQPAAYENRPLPIGEDQTISQPYIVALMTDLADVSGGAKVLEVGTGSGYQAAILAELAAEVYTIEIIPALGQRARATLARLGYKNVTVRIGDGYNGWAEHAPFDAILVTAAPEQVPQPLIDQLKPGGKLVIPVGRQYRTQTLRVLEKKATGEIETQDVLPVGFVPLTRDLNQ